MPLLFTSLMNSTMLTPAAPHRYWRVLFTEKQDYSSSYAGLRGLEFRDEAGGSNLAPTASGSTVYSTQFSGDFAAEHVFDGNYASGADAWATVADEYASAFVGYAFAEAVSVAEVALVAFEASYAPIAFRVQYSDDGIEWREAFTVPKAEPWTEGLMQVFSMVDYPKPENRHRYWRLYVTANGGRGTTCLVELLLRGVPGGGSLAAGGEALASGSYSSSYRQELAFDHEPDSAWFSESGAMPCWIGYDFGEGNEIEVAEFAIDPRHDALDGTPVDFELQYSDEGTSWTTAHSETGVSWASTSTQTFTLA